MLGEINFVPELIEWDVAEVMPDATTGMITIPQRTFERTTQKIDSFLNLPKGWDYGEGGPIPSTTIQLAHGWHSALRNEGFRDADAFAGGGGEIVIATGFGDHYLEVIVEPDHSISVAYDFKGKQVFFRLRRSALEAMQAIRYVKEKMGDTWNVFDYSTPTNIIQSRKSLPGLHLETWTGDYQLLSGTAFNLPVLPLQSMYGSTTFHSQMSPQSHPYSGSSTPASFQWVMS